MERQLITKPGTQEAKTNDYRPSSLSHEPHFQTRGFLHSRKNLSNKPKLYPAKLQTKLEVSQPGDLYEQEAEQVDEQVMRMPTTSVSSMEFSKIPVFPDRLQRKCSNSCKQNTGFHSSGYFGDRIPQPQRNTADQAVQRLLKSRALQAKLKISQPDDIYEQEADQVAEQVMRMPNPILHPMQRCTSNKDYSCREELSYKKLMRKEAQIHAINSDIPSIVHNVLQSPGQQLDAKTRAFMEPRFGHDFGDVRVHTDSEAIKSANAVNASAYTVGNNIVFGEGQYAPNSDYGRKLLGHELTHVVQQTDSTKMQHQISRTENLSEIEAKRISSSFLVFSHQFETQPSIHYSPSRILQRDKTKVPCNSGHEEGSINPLEKQVIVSGFEFNYVMWGTWKEGDNLESFIHRTASLAVLRSNLSLDVQAEMVKNFTENIGTNPKLVPIPGCQYTVRISDNLMAQIQVKVMEGAVEESRKLSKEPISPISQDLNVLRDSTLADHYLKILEHYTGRSITTQDTTNTVDGLSNEEINTVIEGKPLRKALTALYTQGYREYQAAKGSDKEKFFKLIEVIAEQYTRGNPTAVYNNLMIGYGNPENNILGIIGRNSGILYYDADGQPLIGLAGVGMRDKGYIGSRIDDQFGFNIANIKDEGLRALLNSLRQTFADPTRMTKEAAEIYYQNIELVNKEVQKSLSTEVFKKFQDMLPIFIGFLAGHGVSEFLSKVPNAAVAAVGLVLKGLLITAGYIMNIDFGVGALQRLLNAAYHLTRIEKNEKGELTKLSGQHLRSASVPLRDMISDITLMLATSAMVKIILRGAACINCTRCKLTEKKYTGVEVEKSERTSFEKFWKGRATNTSFGVSKMKFNKIAEILKERQSHLNKEGKGQLLPEVNSDILRLPVDTFIKHYCSELRPEWERLRRNSELRNVMDNVFGEGKESLVGNRELDMAEFLLEERAVEITDVTLKYLDPVHAFKTKLYKAIMQKLLGDRGPSVRAYEFYPEKTKMLEQ